MGFTVYWSTCPTLSETFAAFVADLKKVIRYSNLTEEEGIVHLQDQDNECETFSADRIGRGRAFCKTQRKEFTYDVMAACVLMKHYNMALAYSNDDEREFPWLPVEEYVKDTLGWNIAALKARIAELEEKLRRATFFARQITEL